MPRSYYKEVLHQMFAGAMSGACAAIATAPLDLAKTRMQVEYAPRGALLQPKYRGLTSTLATTLKEEGMRGWFKGLGSCLLGLVPSWTIYFTCYNSFKRVLLDTDALDNLIRLNRLSTKFEEEHASVDEESHSQHKRVIVSKSEAHMLAAMGAGLINATLTNPLWVVKVRMQTQNASPSAGPSRYTSIPGAFRTIVREEGYAGLFKGLPVSLFGTIHVVIQFPLYEYLKETSKSKHAGEELKLGDILIASVVSKLVASSVTYPHELLRARFQRQRVQHYHSIGDALVKIFREEGPEAFYRGMGTNLLRVVPTSAITLAVYEYALKFINSVDP